MAGMKDFENCNRDRSQPEEINLSMYGLLLTGAVRKSDGGWMRGYQLLHPGAYACDDETTILRLKVMLPEAEDALRAYDWGELDELEDNMDGRSSRYSVAMRQTVGGAASFSLKESGRSVSSDNRGSGAEEEATSPLASPINRRASQEALERQSTDSH